VAHPFAADRPITGRHEDLLGRASFSESFAGAIEGWRQNDSLVVALYGTWGSGKTSLRNMVVEFLRARSTIDVVEFSPWEWSSQEQIAEAFFDQIGQAVGRRGGKDARKRAAKWRAYAARLHLGATALRGPRGLMSGLLLLLGVVGLGSLAQSQWIRTTLAVIGAISVVLAGFLRWGGQVAQSFADALTARVEAEQQSPPDLKTELSSLLLSREQAVLVTIDDVDRLRPEEIRLLFQLIKVNADFPNLIYFLLFDRGLIEQALEADPVASGRDYLEKIVQVGFDIPQVERTRLEKVLFASLDELLRIPGVADRWDKQRWARLFVDGLRPFLENLRDIRRFVATLSFHVALLRREETLEVNPIDIIGLEALRVFEPAVYRALPGGKPALTTPQPDSSVFFDSADRDAWIGSLQKLINDLDTGHEEAVREILKELFPPAAPAFGGQSYGGLEERWMRDLRVCSPDFFDRYFLLGLPEEDLPQAALDGLLAVSGDRDALVGRLRVLQQEGRLETALARLEAYKQQIATEHSVSFITAMFDMGDDLSDESDDFFGISPAMHGVRIIHWHLKREPDAHARAQSLGEAMRQTTGLFLPVMTISIEDPRDGERGDPSEALVGESDLAQLKDLCVDMIRAAAASSRLRGHPRMLYILYRWKEWGADDEAEAWVSSVVLERDGLLNFLQATTHRVRSHTMGNYLAEDQNRVRLEDIESFVSADEILRLVDALDESGLTKGEARAVAAFRQALEGRAQGRSDEDWDAL
jgi:predicted KAP-like P-loop ATPase